VQEPANETRANTFIEQADGHIAVKVLKHHASIGSREHLTFIYG
jgi:hypothetical protein